MADGIINKMKRVIGLEDEYSDDFGGGNFDDLVDDVSVDTNRYSNSPSYDYDIDNRNSLNDDFIQPKVDPSSKVVSMQSVTSSSAAKKQHFKLVITEPKDFNDCPKLVDSLRTRKPVIINVEHLEREDARKIFDFLSGATYAIDGRVQKISEKIFVFAPANVDVLSADEDSEEDFVTTTSYSRDAQMRWS